MRKNQKGRVWNRKGRVCVCLITVLFFCCNFFQETIFCKAEEGLPEEISNLYALSAVLMDAESGRVLVSKDGEEMRPMASTTKIMTCILALEEGNLDEEVNVSQEAAKQPAVHLQMQEGQTFRLGDLLYSLMLESHNDTAVAIAEHIGGTVEGFAEKMNAKAKELGCEHTYFITPNGLDAEDEYGVHSISAEDLATIMSYCIMKSPKAEAFLEITRTNSYEFTDVSGEHSYVCQNHNSFLGMMEGALSGKTGFTGDAGYCYVGALRREERTFVVALLGCGWPNNKDYKWVDTRKLMEYAVENYHYRNVPVVQRLQEIPVENGNKKDVDLFEEIAAEVKVEGTETSFEVLIKEGEEIEAQISKKKKLQAPVKNGETVGNLTYYLEGEAIKEFRIVVTEDIPNITYPDILMKLWKMYVQFSFL